jgi:hypothetical protein
MSESEELQHDQAQRWESGIGVGQVHNTRRSEQTPADHLQSTGNKAPVKLSSVPPAQLGLKVINPGSQNIRVDIVAVHGLGAIPDITWRDNKSGVEWISNPEMLPKSTPEARIMRFGYDSLWFGEEPIRTTLSTIADNLLRALQREREVKCFSPYQTPRG